MIKTFWAFAMVVTFVGVCCAKSMSGRLIPFAAKPQYRFIDRTLPAEFDIQLAYLAIVEGSRHDWWGGILKINKLICRIGY